MAGDFRKDGKVFSSSYLTRPSPLTAPGKIPQAPLSREMHRAKEKGPAHTCSSKKALLSRLNPLPPTSAKNRQSSTCPGNRAATERWSKQRPPQKKYGTDIYRGSSWKAVQKRIKPPFTPAFSGPACFQENSMSSIKKESHITSARTMARCTMATCIRT